MRSIQVVANRIFKFLSLNLIGANAFNTHEFGSGFAIHPDADAILHSSVVVYGMNEATGRCASRLRNQGKSKNNNRAPVVGTDARFLLQILLLVWITA
jgi:hypothetical protein